MGTVAEFLVERLESVNVQHVFAVSGQYIREFLGKLGETDKLQVVHNSDEAHAGFAADAYARVHGVGVVCVTHNVGALKLVNAVAGAYVERSPVIVISGAPDLKHHSPINQRAIFEKITCASVVLDNPLTAGYEIDRAFEALKHTKQPIYIELPLDVSQKSINYDVYNFGTPEPPKSEPEVLDEAFQEVVNWIQTAENPVILAGVELARYNLAAEMLRFSEKHLIPIATTLLSKSVISEKAETFLGTYCGVGSDESVRKRVDESDCLLSFGVMLPDLMQSGVNNRKHVVSASVQGLSVRGHCYQNVQFADFCHKLFSTSIERQTAGWSVTSAEKTNRFEPKEATVITIGRLCEKVNSILNRNMVVIADPGDALFAAGGLTIHHRNQFIAPAYYMSMGFAIPAALGVQLARPELRPIVFVGDGSFQMSSSELSTILNKALNPIVIILNNDGYGTDKSFNIRRWNYHDVVKVLNGGQGIQVRTETDLDKAMRFAIDSEDLVVLNVVLERGEISPCTQRLKM